MSYKFSFLLTVGCCLIVSSSVVGQPYRWKGVRTPIPMGVQDSSGFTSWQWLNPLPQGNDLPAIIALDNLTAIAAGRNGTMMETWNGGLTWSVVHHVAGASNCIQKIVSPDTGILIAVGNNFPSGSSLILRSANNGSTWEDRSINTALGLNDVVFIRPTLGYAVGGSGVIYRTVYSQLPVESKVRLQIYNVLGQVISLLRDDLENAGYKQVTWSAQGSPSGVYFYKLDAVSSSDPGKSFTQVRKMLLIK